MTTSPDLSLQRTSKLKEYAELVKFEHTIFALPFALSAMLLACAPHQWPSVWTMLWILLAMVGGRTYAMALNRLIDAQIDAKNPRLPIAPFQQAELKKIEAWMLVVFAGSLLAFATFQLPLICRLLLPVAYLILTIYSYMKRFSSLAHLVLGVALGSSAVGGWLAVTGQISLAPILFGMAVVFWVAGFDVIYACQDTEFDQKEGLHSIPSRFGVTRALQLSRLFHVITILLMVSFGLITPTVSWGYWCGVVLMGGMLIYEQRLVSANNLEKINEAFFTVNGQISLSIFVLILTNKLLQ